VKAETTEATSTGTPSADESTQLEPQSRESLSGSSSAHSDVESRTTVQLRCIPPHLVRRTLILALDKTGFAGQYSFVYVPIDFTHNVNLGYAMISLETSKAATGVLERFNGIDWPEEEAEQPGGGAASSVATRESKERAASGACEASWSEPRQTLEEYIERYRNSPVMHPCMPDEHKPALFKGGARVQFPPPTKTLRRPRIRHVKEN